MDRIKAWCLNSATIALSYLMAACGTLLEVLGNIGDALGDPALKTQIEQQLGQAGLDPKTTARVLLAMSIVVFLARIRSIRKQP